MWSAKLRHTTWFSGSGRKWTSWYSNNRDTVTLYKLWEKSGNSGLTIIAAHCFMKLVNHLCFILMTIEFKALLVQTTCREQKCRLNFPSLSSFEYILRPPHFSSWLVCCRRLQWIYLQRGWTFPKGIGEQLLADLTRCPSPSNGIESKKGHFISPFRYVLIALLPFFLLKKPRWRARTYYKYMTCAEIKLRPLQTLSYCDSTIDR